MVFLVGRGGDGVHTGGVRKNFVFRNKGGGRLLGNHETGVRASPVHQKSRKTAQEWVDQPFHPALRNAGHLRDGHAEHIQSPGYRLAVEISSQDKILRLREK
jgi:hypothetical protein